ncbi:MAG: GTPase HflX [bacterium]|nr:GTPase HflX [bacterium]
MQTVSAHLDELERLVDTAGGIVVERFTQERRAPDPATFVGAGFVDRIGEWCHGNAIQTIVFDEDLSPSQVRNLERRLDDQVKILDRAAVILDIFARRARSREAQTQVELAQLTYLLSRLTRRWSHLSRQDGGIGTRGVGETQLEIDRRLISVRISHLKQKLKVIEKGRRLRRERRQTQSSIALVGYTNAGKSSLFRRLTRADVLVEDQLFATIDPKAKQVSLGEGVLAVITDTVGFIRKLPHHLVAPFRSTLEEAVEADIVVHVVDVSEEDWESQRCIGEEVLEGLGVDPARVILVLNKIDLLPGGACVDHAPDNRIFGVSAVSGAGVDDLCCRLRSALISAAGVTIVKVPLAQKEMVERAVRLPHRLAQHFQENSVEVAVRISQGRLAELGLDIYRVDEWEGSQ